VLRRVLFIPIIGLVLAGVAAGCSDTKDLEDRIGAVEQQQLSLGDEIRAISDATQRTAVVTALNVLGNAGLHDIDEAAAASEVDAGASGGVEDAIIAMSAVVWPEELATDAEALIADLEALATALESADAAVVAEPATTAHDAAHDFEHAAANHIKEAVGLPVEEDEHDEGGETPAAGETPEGG
jgi:hypothetical protein